jgi:uncharacterized protein YpuA (DUF1002 family)
MPHFHIEGNMNSRKPKSRVVTPKPEPGKVIDQVFEDLKNELGRDLTSEETNKVIDLAKRVCNEGENIGLKIHYPSMSEAIRDIKVQFHHRP